MASSSGSASAAPTPRRNVRRRDRTISLSSTFVWLTQLHHSLSAPASGTARSSRCRAPETRTGSRHGAAARHDVADGRHVVVLEPAAERVGQQLLRHRADEHVRPLQQRLHAAPRRRRLGCRLRARPTRRSASRLPACASAPTASKFSSASPRGSITLWQLAHAGFARCCSIRARTVFGEPGVSSGNGGTSGGAAAAACRSDCRGSTCPAPPATCGRRATSPAGSRPCRAGPFALLVERDAPEMRAVDVRNAVVPGQPLVDKRVVGGRSGRARCGPRRMMLPTNSSSSRSNAWLRLSSKSGKSFLSGVVLRRFRMWSH